MNFTKDLNEKRVFAYFQPILATNRRNVYAYEVLGRYSDDNGKVKSLGSYFADKNTKSEDALKIDRLVRRDAMMKYARQNSGEYLFINLRLNWISKFKDDPSQSWILHMAKEFDILPEKLVIEITEEEFNSSDECVDVINHYKSAGCRIAIDDFGKGSSNIDRISMFKPNIIKIDMDYIHKSEKSYYYRKYLKHLSDFAESVGIDVLYEGVETQEQLNICTAMSGRLYQGFLLAFPQESMSEAIIDKNPFTKSIERTRKIVV